MTGKSSGDLNHRHTHLVLKYAVVSRLILISLILLWRSLLSPYDTSASINPSCLSGSDSGSASVYFPRLASAIEDSIVWDSVYFVRIAQCGYEYEQTYAFLPLLPICISLLSGTGYLLFYLFEFYDAILWINIYIFYACTHFHRTENGVLNCFVLNRSC